MAQSVSCCLIYGYTLYGDYGFGHFLMCFDSVDGFTDACREAKSHMDRLRYIARKMTILHYSILYYTIQYYTIV